jgi:dihydroorotate dehydrogenase (NAD+) catalytic subunit
MNLEVNLAGLKLKNPVMSASGTYGYGKEFLPFFNPDVLGAVVSKTATLKPRQGNPPPRVVEINGHGMLNSIGLQNIGLTKLLEEATEFLADYNVPWIMNLSENCEEDFQTAASKATQCYRVDALEGNLSCPNVKGEGMLFGLDPRATKNITQAIKEVSSLPLIIKLTPNASNVVEIATAAIDGGADILNMGNTYVGMAIDVHKRKFKIHGGGSHTGGYSGPAIKPMTLAKVNQIYNANLGIPIIGTGGIMTGEDAIEYFLAGANAVQVGTASFKDPNSMPNIIKGIKDYMEKYNIKDINDLVGATEGALNF